MMGGLTEYSNYVCDRKGYFESDLVESPNCWFSRAKAHILYVAMLSLINRANHTHKGQTGHTTGALYKVMNETINFQ